MIAYLTCWRVGCAAVLDFEPVGLNWLTIATCRAVGFFFPSLRAAEVDGAATVFGLRLVGAGDWVWGASVLGGCPRLPRVVWAGFGSALCDATRVVGWATEALGLVFNLAGWRGLRTAWGDAWVRLTRNGLALRNGCASVNEERPVNRLAIRPRTSITSRLNIICFRQA